MRFMIIVKANADSEAGVMPPPEDFAAMEQFNNEVIAAGGILQGGGGLKPSRYGARIEFRGRKPTVIDGPFTETKELIAGFALIDLPSFADAITWMKKWPTFYGDGQAELEIRPLYEAEDFAEAFASGDDARRPGADMARNNS